MFATPFHFVRVTPLETKKHAHFALDEFFQKVGIPHVVVSDCAKEETLGEFNKKCRRAQCKLHPTEPHTKNANLAEGVI